MGVGGNRPPDARLKSWGFVPLPKHVAFFWAGSVFASWVQNPLLYFNLGLLIYRIAVSFFIPCSCWKIIESLPGPIQADDGRWSNSIS